MLDKQRDIENAVRAVLREVGLKLGTRPRKLFADRVRELPSADAAIGDIVEPLLAVLEAMAPGRTGLSDFIDMVDPAITVARIRRYIRFDHVSLV